MEIRAVLIYQTKWFDMHTIKLTFSVVARVLDWRH